VTVDVHAADWTRQKRRSTLGVRVEQTLEASDALARAERSVLAIDADGTGADGTLKVVRPGSTCPWPRADRTRLLRHDDDGVMMGGGTRQ